MYSSTIKNAESDFSYDNFFNETEAKKKDSFQNESTDIYKYIYIYIYRERERERKRGIECQWNEAFSFLFLVYNLKSQLR